MVTPQPARADITALGGRGAILKKGKTTTAKRYTPTHSVGQETGMTYMVACAATTKQGTPCSIEAGKDSEFCHVHDPALQCGFLKRNGQRCSAATGGRGPCPAHRATKPETKKRSQRVRYSPEERRRRRAEREAGVQEALAELDRIAASVN